MISSTVRKSHATKMSNICSSSSAAASAEAIPVFLNLSFVNFRQVNSEVGIKDRIFANRYTELGARTRIIKKALKFGLGDSPVILLYDIATFLPPIERRLREAGVEIAITIPAEIALARYMFDARDVAKNRHYIREGDTIFRGDKGSSRICLAFLNDFPCKIEFERTPEGIVVMNDIMAIKYKSFTVETSKEVWMERRHFFGKERRIIQTFPFTVSKIGSSFEPFILKRSCNIYGVPFTARDRIYAIGGSEKDVFKQMEEFLNQDGRKVVYVDGSDLVWAGALKIYRDVRINYLSPPRRRLQL